MMGAVVEHIKEITVALEAVLEVSFTQLSYDEIHAGTQLRLSDVAFIALLILVPVFVFLVFITTDGVTQPDKTMANKDMAAMRVT